ncbi:MAG: hypothetical protein ACE5IG_06950, partial [Dehalococcoidia bacterium]
MGLSQRIGTPQDSIGMDNQEYLERIRRKIQARTGLEVELVLETEDKGQVAVDLSGPVPRVIMGADVLQYPGLARMGIEYAVACLQKG